VAFPWQGRIASRSTCHIRIDLPGTRGGLSRRWTPFDSWSDAVRGRHLIYARAHAWIRTLLAYWTVQAYSSEFIYFSGAP